MKELPVRKRNRLRNYDYSKNGAYFLTICTKDHRESFGEIVSPVFDRPCRMRLSTIGEIVEKEIAVLSETYPDVFVDKYVVMPNHVHMIVVIDANNVVGAAFCRPSAPTMSRVVGQWKRAVSMKIGVSLWQKSFYDHIIKNRADYDRIAQYIENNPETWEEDVYYKMCKEIKKSQPS